MRRLIGKYQFLIVSILLSTIIVVAQNCDNVRLSLTQPQVSEASSVQANPFGTLEPVLAVRNTACIMCHAQINGDLITDFGSGNQFFMATDDIANHPLQTAYGPFNSRHFIEGGATWSASSIMGNVYVPNVAIKDSRIIASYTAAGNSLSAAGLMLPDFLNSTFLNPLAGTSPISLIPKTTSTDITVAGLRGSFVGRQTIWIDAPSEDEIKDLEQGIGAEVVLSKPAAVVYKGASTDVIKNMLAVQSKTTYKLYMTNSGTVKCKGDIIIDSVLFLNNLVLDTDANGCRLYVTGTVFIQGPVTYLNGGDSNLQITSSRGIIMGMRALSSRLKQAATPLAVGGVRQGWTDADELTLNEAIFNDRDSVDGLTNDAGPFQVMTNATGDVIATMDDFDDQVWAPTAGYTTVPDPNTCDGTACNVMWTGNLPNEATQALYRKTINYSHLLLNAPTIQSRYWGIFQGVVIGENVLFAVNNFQFAKDPLMFRTSLLPLIEDRIFAISDD